MQTGLQAVILSDPALEQVQLRDALPHCDAAAQAGDDGVIIIAAPTGPELLDRHEDFRMLGQARQRPQFGVPRETEPRRKDSHHLTLRRAEANVLPQNLLRTSQPPPQAVGKDHDGMLSPPPLSPSA